jgi:membrane-bound ClpP family serine protease
MRSACCPKAAQVIDLLLEVTGAILILIAFALAQFRGLDRHGFPYLMLNLVGAALLAVSAATHRQWGFLLLQGVWALVALWGLFGLVRQRGAAS